MFVAHQFGFPGRHCCTASMEKEALTDFHTRELRVSLFFGDPGAEPGALEFRDDGAAQHSLPTKSAEEAQMAKIGRVQIIVIEKKRGSKVYRYEERKRGKPVRKERIPFKSDRIRLAIIPAHASSGPKLEQKDYHVYPLTTGRLRVDIFKDPGDEEPVESYQYALRPHKGYPRSVKRGKHVRTENEGDDDCDIIVFKG